MAKKILEPIVSNETLVETTSAVEQPVVDTTDLDRINRIKSKYIRR
jgi:hypothetical protein